MSEILINGSPVKITGSFLTEDDLYPYRNLAKHITISDSVTRIEKWAFFDFKALKNVEISDSVTYIGDGAFGNCSSLRRITIPGSVTTMGNCVFGGKHNNIRIELKNMKGLSERSFSGYAGQSHVIAFDGDEYPIMAYFASRSSGFANGLMVVTGFVDYAKGKLYSGYEFRNNELNPSVKTPVYCYVFKKNVLYSDTLKDLNMQIEEGKY